MQLHKTTTSNAPFPTIRRCNCAFIESLITIFLQQNPITISKHRLASFLSFAVNFIDKHLSLPESQRRKPERRFHTEVENGVVAASDADDFDELGVPPKLVAIHFAVHIGRPAVACRGRRYSKWWQLAAASASPEVELSAATERAFGGEEGTVRRIREGRRWPESCEGGKLHGDRLNVLC